MDDSNENYVLTNVNPSLDTTQTDILLNLLNADGKDGLHSFVVGMSKLLRVFFNLKVICFYIYF